jgi:hypothetical protein
MTAEAFVRSICAALVACVLFSTRSTFGAGEAEKPAAAQGMPGQPGAAPAASQAAAQAFTQPMTLTEDKVTGFLDAMDELKTLGGESSKFSATNPNLVKGMQFSGQTTDIIKKHGFSGPTEFQRVAYNAATAYYVLQNGGKDAMKKKLEQTDAKRAEAMEKLKKHLTADQLKMLEAQISSGTAALHSMAEVPDQNLELVKKYNDRMAALSKR